MISQEELKRLLHYDPETGVFTWRIPTGYRVSEGERAGGLSSTGYLYIGIHGRLYPATRLAWLYMTGSWPERKVMPKNGVKTDLTWKNINAEL